MIIVDEIGAADLVPRSVSQVSSRGPSGLQPKRVLIVANRLLAGNVAADVPYRVLGDTYADYGSGPGSIAAETSRAFRAINKSAELYVLGLADDGSGVVATGGLGLSGTATANGTLRFSVAGREYAQGVVVGDTASTLLTALKATIDADVRRIFAAGSIAASAIPLTSRSKGDAGNYAKIKQLSDNVAGITVALTQPVNGATNPSVTNAIAAIASMHFDRIILCLNDSTTIAAFEAEMLRRFGADVNMQGAVITAVYGTLSDATTFAGSRNSKFVCSPATGLSQTPFWIWAAQVAAVETLATESDGGAIVIDRVLPDCVAPDVADQFDLTDRATLLGAGMATYYVGTDGACYVENLVTNYLTDQHGSADEKFRPLRAMSIIAEYRAKLKVADQKWRDHKLVDNGTPLRPGVKALTPGYYETFMDAFYADYAGTGNVENVEYFRANRRAERSGTSKNRLLTFHPITLGGQVITIASLLEIG